MEVETEMNELDKSIAQEIKQYKDKKDVELQNELNIINVKKTEIT